MTIGITSLLSPVSDHRLVGLVDQLDALGLDVEFVDGPWDDRMAAMTSGRAAAAWVCGLLHVELTAAGGWVPTAVAAPRSSESGEPVYFGRIVVAERSPVRHLDDLKGYRFAFNEESSLSGFRMMRDRLASIGAGLDFFAETIRTGSHIESLRTVIDGRADCAIIDSIVLEDLAPTGVRVVESVGPYPAPPLVVVPDLASELAAAVDPTVWAGVTESDYDRLRSPGGTGR